MIREVPHTFDGNDQFGSYVLYLHCCTWSTLLPIRANPPRPTSSTFEEARWRAR